MVCELLIDVEVAEGFGAVLLGWTAVGAGGLQTSVAEKLGDGDRIHAATDEAGRERMSERVRGDLLVWVRALGDASDDVVCAFHRQPAAALVEEQGGGVGAGPVLALLEPVGERLAELGVDRDLS